MPAPTTARTKPIHGTSARAKRTSEKITVPAPAPTNRCTNPTPGPSVRAHNLDTIRTLGRLLDDLEHLRKQQHNRHGALEREHGSSLPHIDVILQGLKAVEREAEKELVRAWRKHPLAAWQKQQHGLGEKTLARLIAEIGDPAERANPAKLWAYCGLGEPLRKYAKGMTQEELFKLGNPRARSLVWVIVDAVCKQTCPTCQEVRKARKIELGTDQPPWEPPSPDCTCATVSPYRHTYDQRRIATLDRTHERVCPRCGPTGQPAKPGTPWSRGHQQADGKRVLGKRILLDLWIASRPQKVSDTQVSSGAGG